MNRPAFAALLCALLAGGCVQSTHTTDGPMTTATTTTGVLFRTLTIADQQYKYAVYVPRGYDASRPWPCVVFLNGKGECGRDGQRQLGVGLLPAIMLDEAGWPCIVVFPQKPESETAWEDHEAVVLGALEATRREFTVDPSRIALTGLSQGGHGTWVIGSRHPELFSRLAPVCGYGDASAIAPGASMLPVWAFHGEKDDVVKPEQTRGIVAAIKAHAPGADVKATYFAQANHNSWDDAYRTQKLGEWLVLPRR
jgi:predicted peptidase